MIKFYSYYKQQKKTMFRSNRPHVYQSHGVGYGNLVNQWGNQNLHQHKLLGNQPIHGHSSTYFQPTGINLGFEMDQRAVRHSRRRNNSSSSRSSSSSSNGSPSRRGDRQARRQMRKQQRAQKRLMRKQNGMIAMSRLQNRIGNIMHGNGNNPNPIMDQPFMEQPIYNSGISSQPAYYSNSTMQSHPIYNSHMNVDGHIVQPRSMQPIYGPYQ